MCCAAVLQTPDFEALFGAAPGLYLAVLPDAPRYTIVAVTDAYAQATLTDRDALIGRSVFDVLPDNPGDPRAGSAGALNGSLQRVLTTRASHAMPVQRHDVRRPGHEGGGFEERWWSMLNVPVLDRDGSVAYIIHRIEDVTTFIRVRQSGTAAEDAAVHANRAGRRDWLDLQAMATEMERRVALRTDQLRRLAAALQEAEDRERRQIARDLHDDLAQTLAAARIRLAALCADEHDPRHAVARELDELIAQADRATRGLAAQLAPAVLDELGLGPALEWLAEDLHRTFRLNVQVRSEDRADLSPQVRSVLYRAVRELLINVAKHAGTPDATVEMTGDGERLVVRVSDHGVGFDAETLETSPRRGLGLIGVRERLSFIGGTMAMQSSPGGGTVAELTVPLARSDRAGRQPGGVVSAATRRGGRLKTSS